MKLFMKIGILCIYAVVLILLGSSIVSAITKEHFLFTVIRSNSMYPQLERGDLVIINRISDKNQIHHNDVILFKTEKGSYSSKGWIMHRVIGGNEEKGYITKGDANERDDVEDGGTVPLKKEWIAAKALAINGKPIHIPLIGHFALWMEQFQTSPYLFPGFAIALSVIIVVNEILSNRKKSKKKRKTKLEMHLIYLLGGFAISIMMGAMMLSKSHNISLNYQVSESSQGVLMGSSVGIMKIGDQIEKPLVKLSNNSFLPIITTITSRDTQILFSNQKFRMKQGDYLEPSITVIANIPGKYSSSIWVGMFLPVLPTDLIYRLASFNYWVALVIVSTIPGLPIMLYPMFNNRMRRKFGLEIRKKFRSIQKILPI